MPKIPKDKLVEILKYHRLYHLSRIKDTEVSMVTMADENWKSLLLYSVWELGMN